MKNQDKIYDPTEEQNTQYNSVTCSISRSEGV